MDAADVVGRLQRVSRDDIARVTSDEVAHVLQHCSPEELKAAIQVLLERNRVLDVLSHSDERTWCRAGVEVSRVHRQYVSEVLKKRWGLLTSVLPYIPVPSTKDKDVKSESCP